MFRGVFRRFRKDILSTLLKEELGGALSRFRTRMKAQLLKIWNKDNFILIVVWSFSIILIALLGRRFDAYLQGEADEAPRQLAIAIGAGITGLVAIVFSITLFAVQSASDRGTPIMLEEYAKDKRMWLIYFILSAFAVGSFMIALFPLRGNYLTFTVRAEFIFIVSTFCLLVLHFRRAIRLVNPKAIIVQFHRQGLKQIKRVKDIQDSIIDANLKQTRR